MFFINFKYTLFLFLLFNLFLYAQDTTKSDAFKFNQPVKKRNLIQPKYPSYPLIAGFLLTQEANSGDPFAQHELGLRYLLGKGFPKDTSSAVYWIKKAASQNVTAARFNYGIMLINGLGVEWDPFEAYKQFKYSAKMGMPEGQFAYATMMTDNLVVSKNLNEAYLWIKRSADGGFEPAIQALKELEEKGIRIPSDTSGTFEEDEDILEDNASYGGSALISEDWDFDYIDFDEDTLVSKESADDFEQLLNSDTKELKESLGIMNFVQNQDYADSSGISLIRSAADAGSPEALYYLGKLYEYGISLEPDSISALAYYIKSYRLGGFKAVQKILEFIQNGSLFEEIKKRIDNGDSESMYVWAALTAIGFDYRLTENQAFELLEEASASNHIYSLVEIGLCYFSGTLVERDKVKGIVYWERAAELGSLEAAVRLAFYRIQEESESEVIKKELSFLKDMNERGSVLATTVLAYCYETGLAVTADLAKAARLYRSAAQRGNRIAFESLISMYNNLRPDESEFIIYDDY